MSDIDELKQLARMADEKGDKETALAALRKLDSLPPSTNPSNPTDPTKGNTFGENALIGFGKGIVGAGRAIKGIINRPPTEEEIAHGGFYQPDGGYRKFLPGELENRASSNSLNQENIDESKRLDQPLMKTGGGMVGDLAAKIATVAPAMAIPGANTVVGSALIGGLQGALEPTATGESRGQNIASNAIVGGGVSSALKGAGTLLKSGKGMLPAAQKMIDEGITPTIGQMTGGTLKRVEEGLTSVPFVGDAILSAQKRGIKEFNQAALDKVLKPIGSKIDKNETVGRDLIDSVHSKVSSEYDKILPTLKGKTDSELLDSLNSVKEVVSELPKERGKQLEDILQNKILSKFDQNGNIYGENLKEMDSSLGTLIARYKNSPDGDQRALGEALTSAKDAIRAMLIRNNPKSAEALKNVDKAYATLLRVERAAGSMGAKNGVFTPAQLTNAVKTSDQSLRKSGFARGKSLLQDFAESGKEVLSNNVPDSGTAYRLSLKSVPEMAAGAAASIPASILYSKAGQKAVAKLLTKEGVSNPELLKLGSATRLGASVIAPDINLKKLRENNDRQ